MFIICFNFFTISFDEFMHVLLLIYAETKANGSMDSGSSQLPMTSSYSFNQQNSVVEPSRNYYQVFVCSFFSENFL